MQIGSTCAMPLGTSQILPGKIYMIVSLSLSLRIVLCAQCTIGQCPANFYRPPCNGSTATMDSACVPVSRPASPQFS